MVALAFVASPAQGAEVKIGGTGAALGTMRILLDEFTAQNPEIAGRVLPSLGSSGGIKAVLDGAIDLAVSSRPPKAKEAARGASAVKYGTTAVVLAVPASNPIAEITREELLQYFTGVRPTWPDGRRLQFVLRPASEADNKILESYLPEAREALESLRANTAIPVAYTDQDAADRIELLQGGLGTAALSLIVAEGRALKALTLDGIPANEQTIASGAYPMTKSFYLVTESAPDPMVRRFIRFVQSPAGQTILRATGHLPELS